MKIKKGVIKMKRTIKAMIMGTSLEEARSVNVGYEDLERAIKEFDPICEALGSIYCFQLIKIISELNCEEYAVIEEGLYELSDLSLETIEHEVLRKG